MFKIHGEKAVIGDTHKADDGTELIAVKESGSCNGCLGCYYRTDGLTVACYKVPSGCGDIYKPFIWVPKHPQPEHNSNPIINAKVLEQKTTSELSVILSTILEIIGKRTRLDAEES